MVKIRALPLMKIGMEGTELRILRGAANIDRFFSMNPSIIMLRFPPCSKITVISFSDLIATGPECPVRALSFLCLTIVRRL